MKSERMAPVKQRELPLEIPEGESNTGELLETNSDDYSSLMKRVLEPENLQRAYLQVRRNQGAPGIDGMTVEELPDYLKTHWKTAIRVSLEEGRYWPRPVKRVEIPKPDGRKRKLGIPTVLDRLIQQALAQVLQEEWEPVFHERSYGFRPNRNAHQAVRYAQETIQAGYGWIVDGDLDSFFDRVNHDLLMWKLKQRIADANVLRLINRFLKAGIQIEGKRQASTEGVPQGGPLSPVLSNILLNELDWELEKRGHRFVRYADDFMVFTKSRIAGGRIKENLQRFIERTLRLKVNADKSGVDKPWNRTFLGFTFSRRRGNKIKVSDKALRKLKATTKDMSRRMRGHSINQIVSELRITLLGWKAYFSLAEALSPLRDVDKWIRRRLRCYLWKQWGVSGYRQLRRRGVSTRLAWNTSKSAHGAWRLSISPALYQALPNSYFTGLGLPKLAA